MEGKSGRIRAIENGLRHTAIMNGISNEWGWKDGGDQKGEGNF